jgi:hypothetical protein
MRRVMPLGLLLACLAGCGPEPIQTYQVPKEKSPSLPLAASSGAHAHWTAPPAWVEQPPSGMRVASFLVTARRGTQADVSVVALAGEAGGALANINRWREQLELEPVSEQDLPRLSTTMSAGGQKMLLVDFTSRRPLIQDMHKQRTVAAVAERGETTWFFKMMGEESAVKEARPDFLRFLRSVRFDDQAH